MNPPPTNIFIGDFVRAVRTLQPSGNEATATCAAVARLLGFDLDTAEATATAGAAENSRPRGPTAPAVKRPSRRRDGPNDVPPPVVEESRWIPSLVETQKLKAALPDSEDLWTNVDSLPAGLSEPWDGPPVEPLFVSRWTRGILHALAATRRDGELDLERLVERVGRAEPLTRLPRRSGPTLRRGLRVLVDVGPGMMPFASDTRWLLERLRDVVGPERTRASVFAGAPWRGPLRDGYGNEVGAWSPPPAGTPVLVVGDLGASRKQFPLESALECDWVEFARNVRHAGCPLIALSPWPVTRYTPALRQSMALIHWDRRTTAGRLRRQVRRVQPPDRSSDARL